MDYKIIESNPEDNLETLVKKAIKEWWQPIGWITTYTNTAWNIRFIQPMINTNLNKEYIDRVITCDRCWRTRNNWERCSQCWSSRYTS